MWKVKQTRQGAKRRTNRAEPRRQNTVTGRGEHAPVQKEEPTFSKAALHPQFSLMRGRRMHGGYSPTQFTVPAVHSWLGYICPLSHGKLRSMMQARAHTTLTSAALRDRQVFGLFSRRPLSQN